jgi:UrcA family protein
MKPLAQKLTLAVAALGLAGSAISPALAGNTERMTISVPTSDIDLGTVEGQQRLDLRLEKAVRTVCRVTSPTTGTRIMSQDTRACLAKARFNVKQQVAALIAREQRGG